MARTIVKIPYTNYEQTQQLIRNIMLSHGFKERFSKEGVYWQKGDGFFVQMKRMKYDFSETEITVSAWLMNMGIETKVTGMSGAAKLPLEIIQQIKLTIKSV